MLSVKFGALRDPGGRLASASTAARAAVKNFLAYTLRRLGTDHVDIYRPAASTPSVPIEETVGAIAEMVKAGYVRHVGLSEVGAETHPPRARAHPISDLQIEYSLISRGIEDEILPTCRELGIGVTAYGVLSRGLLSGHWSQGPRHSGRHDFRSHAPRFSGENLERNLALVEALRAVAEAKGATVAQVAIAWVLSRGDDIVPLVGARTARPARRGARRARAASSTADDLARDRGARCPPGAAAGDALRRPADGDPRQRALAGWPR